MLCNTAYALSSQDLLWSWSLFCTKPFKYQLVSLSFGSPYTATIFFHLWWDIFCSTQCFILLIYFLLCVKVMAGLIVWQELLIRRNVKELPYVLSFVSILCVLTPINPWKNWEVNKPFHFSDITLISFTTLTVLHSPTANGVVSTPHVAFEQPLDKPRWRWKDNIETVFKEISCENVQWIELVYVDVQLHILISEMLIFWF